MCTTLRKDAEDLCSLLFLLEAPSRALDKLLNLCISSLSYGNTCLFPPESMQLFGRKHVALCLV